MFLKKAKQSKEDQNKESTNDDLIYTIKKSCDTFLNGFFYSMVRFTISHAMNFGNDENNEKEFNVKSFLSESVCTGIEFASFDFTNGICDSIFKPNLNTFSKWIPWTVFTSSLSAVVSKSIQLPLMNNANYGKLSYKGYEEEIKVAIPHSIGFNLTRLYADMVLPPKDKIGGKYVRSSLCITAGNFGSAVLSLPSLVPQYPMKSIVLGFLPIVPLCFIENAIYSSVKRITKPIKLLPK